MARVKDCAGSVRLVGQGCSTDSEGEALLGFPRQGSEFRRGISGSHGIGSLKIGRVGLYYEELELEDGV